MTASRKMAGFTLVELAGVVFTAAGGAGPLSAPPAGVQGPRSSVARSLPVPSEGASE